MTPRTAGTPPALSTTKTIRSTRPDPSHVIRVRFATLSIGEIVNYFNTDDETHFWQQMEYTTDRPRRGLRTTSMNVTRRKRKSNAQSITYISIPIDYIIYRYTWEDDMGIPNLTYGMYTYYNVLHPFDSNLDRVYACLWRNR